MTIISYDDFIASLDRNDPPSLPSHLEALWWDYHGNWERAHDCLQGVESLEGCWVHAYLHRKEGGLSNADYWYRMASKKRPDLTITEEWSAIVRDLL